MGKFKLKSGNTPTFKMMGSAFLQPSGEDIKEDLKERLNLENIKKPELNIDTEDLKERINIEKPKVNVETHVETPRSGEFTGDQGELRNPDLEQKTQEQLESQGYDDVNVIRGHRNPDDEPLRENRKKYYSHATATSGDSDEFTKTTQVSRPENPRLEEPYTTEFLGGHTDGDISQARGVVWNESTQKYEPKEGTYYGPTPDQDVAYTEGFAPSDYERISDYGKVDKDQGFSQFYGKTGR